MKTSIINPYLIYKPQSKYQRGYYEVIASVLTEIFQIAHIKNTGNHGFLEYCSIGPKPECSKTVPEASAKNFNYIMIMVCIHNHVQSFAV